ncbi:MAG: hypothetical protein ACLGH8_09420, partial [Bacteroidia bacterium]
RERTDKGVQGALRYETITSCQHLAISFLDNTNPRLAIADRGFSFLSECAFYHKGTTFFHNAH